jgi:hypothetical protein
MSSFMDTYFGPLPREYCVYFYILTIMSAIAFVMSSVTIAYYMATHIKKVDAMFVFNSFYVLFSSFLVYFVNRMLHSMCVKSL